MNKKFFSGDSVQQALLQAARFFQVEPDDVAYREVDRRHGFLRGRRRAVIEVDIENPVRASGSQGEAPAAAPSPSPEPPPEPPTDSRVVADEGREPEVEKPAARPPATPAAAAEAPAAEPPRAARRDESRPFFAPRAEPGPPATTDRGGSSAPADRVPDSPSAVVAEGSAPYADAPQATEVRDAPAAFEAPGADAPDEVDAPGESEAVEGVSAAPGVAAGSDDDLADAARQALSRLFELGHLDLEVAKIEQGGERLEVELRGADEEILLEDRGRLLLAIQHLLPRMLRGLTGRSAPCQVDCDDFHEIRTEQLRDLAQRVASEVRNGRRSKTLEPMSPDERRIVHLTLADDPAVETVSQGNGLFKRVQIRPQKMQPRGFDPFSRE